MDQLTTKQIGHFKRKIGPATRKGCQLWTAGQNEWGYGKFSFVVNEAGDITTQAAHRVAYFLAQGPIPEGLCVCHECDVRLCVNPAHLFLGTHQVNSTDMVNKERSARGQAQGSCILVDANVLKIITRYKEGHSKAAIAREFDVSWTTIRKVVEGYTWSWLTGIPAKKWPPRR